MGCRSAPGEITPLFQGNGSLCCGGHAQNNRPVGETDCISTEYTLLGKNYRVSGIFSSPSPAFFYSESSRSFNMQFHFYPIAVAIVSLLSSRAIAEPSSGIKSRTAIDDFVSRQAAISLQGALNNIGPDGSEVPGAGAGFVVASPSKIDPPCKCYIRRSIQ